MQIELKNIHHIEAMSEETNCFTASLYVDGTRIGQVSNDGHGGSDRFEGDFNAYERADQWCRQNLPPADEEGTVPTCIEIHCGDLLTRHLCRRDMRNAMKRKALFMIPGKEGVFQIGYRRTKKQPDDELFADVIARHPGATILNKMPEDDALALFMSNG